MTVTRMTVFVALKERTAELRDFLKSLVPTIAGSPGCHSCQLLQGQDQPERFVVIEVWDSVDAHQASVKQIPPASLAAVMPLLGAPPKGEYLLPL
jgi:quinol monooxygenase YgiN